MRPKIVFHICSTVLVCFYAFSLQAQIASYPLSTDAKDVLGGFNATVSANDVSFETDGYASIGRDGLITLPPDLSNGIFSDGSIYITFDFKLDESEYALLFSGSERSNRLAWDENGFQLHIDRDELILNYANGDDSGQYEWKGFHQVERNRWYSLGIIIDLEDAAISIELDGQANRQKIADFMDLLRFRQGIESNRFTIGGLDGEKPDNFRGTFAIKNLNIYAPAPSAADELNRIYQDLTKVLNGNLSLSDSTIKAYSVFAEANLPFVHYAEVATDLLLYSQNYEAKYPPLYEDGLQYSRDNLPPLDRALQAAQDFILQKGFTPGNLDQVEGLIFEHHLVAPGPVNANTSRIPSASVDLNGSYQVEKAAALTDQGRVVRPTGYYLAAGDMVNIKVPEAVTGQGLSVIVGAHFRNMDYNDLQTINRFPDISTEFPLDATEIRIGNPLGGGIYLKVPDGTDAGWFSMTIEGAIQSPYFSYRENRKTDVADWLQQVANTGAPWADFESDKFMFTVPIALLNGVDNPDEIMARWDEIMDAIRLVAGRSFTRSRAEYYTSDTRLVTPAFGAGYPLVINKESMIFAEEWNPLKVLKTPAGPILLHEMGHNHLQPTLDLGAGYNSCGDNEAETIVQMLGVSVYSNVYGQDLEEAFQNSSFASSFTRNEACFDWIITTNFRQNLPMTFDETAPMPDKQMLKYQPRGWAKYVDIIQLYDWEGIGAVNGKFYPEGGIQTGTACPGAPWIVGRDEYIQAACEALGENVTPLFHFWGIQPSAELAVQMANYPKSQKVKALIETYRCEVAPGSYDDYLRYHHQMYDPNDYQQPRYDEYILNFDDGYVTAIQNQFDFLLNTYGLTGPVAPTELATTTSANTIDFTWQDNATNESGFILRQRQVPDGTFTDIAQIPTNASSYQVTVLLEGAYEFQLVAVNSEGLESNACTSPKTQVNVTEISTATEEIVQNQGLVLYPNPVKGPFFLKNMTGKTLQRLAIYDLAGRLQIAQELLPQQLTYIIAPIPELPKGMYLIKVWEAERVHLLRLVVE